MYMFSKDEWTESQHEEYAGTYVRLLLQIDRYALFKIIKTENTLFTLEATEGYGILKFGQQVPFWRTAIQTMWIIYSIDKAT